MSCSDCIYNCVHTYSKKKVCWSCFATAHLGAVVFKIENLDFFPCNEEIRKKMQNCPGYILCYNYKNKIYKLIKVNDLVKSNFYLIKHIVSKYLFLNKKKSLFKIASDMSTINYTVLDSIFKQKYTFDLEKLKVIEI